MNLSFVLLLTMINNLSLMLCMERNDYWYLCPTDQGDCEDVECTITEGARRAGYLCDTFPWYSGGQWPTEWNDEDEYYTCQDIHLDNDTTPVACSYWSANEYSGHEHEIGICSCIEFSDNNLYCNSWVCYQTEDENYQNIAFRDCGTTTSITISDSDTDSYINYCADSNTEYELLRCWCISESSNEYYCKEWYCNQYEINQNGDETYEETEIYRCLSNIPSINSPYYNNNEYNDGKFCWEWYGDINSDDQFELTNCECKAVINNNFCSDWYCYEKGMDKYIDTQSFNYSLIITIIGSILCIASTILCSRICNPRNRTCVYFVILFTFSIFATISIMVGGIASFLIWFIIWILLLQYFWVFRPTNSCFAWDEICGCDPFKLCGFNNENEEDNDKQRKKYDADGRQINA